MINKPLDIEKESMIKILWVGNIDPGEEPSKESIEAYFLCSITWCPRSTDTHVAEDEAALTSTERVYINSFGKSDITPGIYNKISSYKNYGLFEKVA